MPSGDKYINHTFKVTGHLDSVIVFFTLLSWKNKNNKMHVNHNPVIILTLLEWEFSGTRWLSGCSAFKSVNLFTVLDSGHFGKYIEAYNFLDSSLFGKNGILYLMLLTQATLASPEWSLHLTQSTLEKCHIWCTWLKSFW